LKSKLPQKGLQVPDVDGASVSVASRVVEQVVVDDQGVAPGHLEGLKM
jgi:hypothetical protein